MNTAHSQRWVVMGLVAGLLCSTGCGVLTFRQPDLESFETGENGEVYVLDDLRDIANDEDLNEQEKRDLFHSIGIEDEDFIDGLLDLPDA